MQYSMFIKFNFIYTCKDNCLQQLVAQINTVDGIERKILFVCFIKIKTFKGDQLKNYMWNW